MSDITVTPDPAATAIDLPAPGQKPAPSVPEKDKAEPDWLAARLDQAKRSVLKELGIDSVDVGKKAVDAAKAADEAKKTNEQKLAEFEASNRTLKASAEAMAQTLGVMAKAQMAALDDSKRAAVQSVAGDDPAKQLSTIEALKPTWAQAAANAATQAPVIDTTAAKSAPSSGASASPPDPRVVYAELDKVNPILAARYAHQNGVFEWWK